MSFQTTAMTTSAVAKIQEQCSPRQDFTVVPNLSRLTPADGPILAPDDLLRFLDSVGPVGDNTPLSQDSSFTGLSSLSLSTPFAQNVSEESSPSAVSPPFGASSDGNALGLASLNNIFAFTFDRSKDPVEPQLSSPFSLNSKAFDAGDINLPFDLSAPALDILALPLFQSSPHSADAGACADPLRFDASLDSPLGLLQDGSPWSELLASPMFSLTGSEPASAVASELPLPSPPAEASAGSAPALPLFPPLPHSDSFPLSTALRPLPPLPTRPSPTPLPTGSSSSSSDSPSLSNRPAPTGFRSTSLLPIDAPIQPRNAVLPSSTTRKRKTAGAEKALAKRARADTPSAAPPTVAAAQGDEELPADIVAAMERKRLQNTISARKSRARKANHVQELQAENERLKQENEVLAAKVAEFERRMSGEQ
ncbi:hypothetical protein JCM1841_001759 [Sporobolomyces salmonicolor]